MWMTDKTPHEALPVNKRGMEGSCMVFASLTCCCWPVHRQFFRVVTSKVNVWYSEHNTPNKLVALPPEVQLVHGNKFKQEEQKGGYVEE